MDDWLNKHTQIKLGLFSIIGAFLVTFSNLICIPWELTMYGESERMAIYGAYLFRLVYFVGVIGLLLEFNLQGVNFFSFVKRFWGNLGIVAGAYLLFALICHLLDVQKIDCSRYSVYIQFLVVFVFSLFFGHLLAHTVNVLAAVLFTFSKFAGHVELFTGNLCLDKLKCFLKAFVLNLL